MSDSASPVRVNGRYAHVYYDVPTRPVAEQVREGLARAFRVEFGRFLKRQLTGGSVNTT
jgi:aromatic ring-cleaving dioxygenase